MITINRDLCKGCTYCVSACPKANLRIASSFNALGYFPSEQTDESVCTGCALCAMVCPEIAIDVWREEKN